MNGKAPGELSAGRAERGRTAVAPIPDRFHFAETRRDRSFPAAPARPLRSRQGARFVRRRLRRRPAQPQVARHPAKGPADSRQSRPSRGDRRRRQARRWLRRARADSARLLCARMRRARPAPCPRPVIMRSASSSCRATPRRAPRSKRSSKQVVAEEGQTLIGWRDIPVDNADLGERVKAVEPAHRQLFIGRGPDVVDENDFERKLFILRKVVSNRIYAASAAGFAEYYPVSMSCRTIVYKGMVLFAATGALLRRLAGPALRDRAGARAPALRHQHLPVLAARPSLSDGRP